MEPTTILMLLLIIAIGDSAHIPPYELSDDFIDSINKMQSTWTAGRNFKEDADVRHIKHLMGITEMKKHSLPMKFIESSGYLPEQFDARDQWPECTSIGTIRDQGDCGSSWAVAITSTISDRICIGSNATLKPFISADDLMSCCTACGGGCYGGDPKAAWQYWIDSGIVTGGEYNSHQGCRPYEIAPCDHYINGTRKECPREYAQTPSCVQKCESNYSRPYNADLYFGQDAHSIPFYQSLILEEIYHNGPVQGAMWVYSDFLHYKQGVYENTGGEFIGGLAVKIIGWGVENDVDYWLVANSWNTDWGDNGFFKIRRGVLESCIECDINIGTPKF